MEQRAAQGTCFLSQGRPWQGEKLSLVRPISAFYKWNGQSILCWLNGGGPGSWELEALPQHPASQGLEELGAYWCPLRKATQ